MSVENSLLPPYNLVGHELDWPLINAAGSINGTSEENIIREVKILAATGIGAITKGTITIPERLGSGPPGYYIDKNTLDMYNNMGLPNIGIRRAKKLASKVVAIAHEKGKPAIISASAASYEGAPTAVEQAVQLAEELLETDYDLIEINAGCPHIRDQKGRYEPILGHSYEAVDDLCAELYERVGETGRLVIKVPYINEKEQEKNLVSNTAEALRRWKVFSALVTSNTIPRLRPVDDKGEPIFKDIEGNLASLSGYSESVRAAGRNQLNMWQLELGDENIDIISTLGVGSGREMAYRMRLGAVATAGVYFLWKDTDWKKSVEAMLQEFHTEISSGD
jgi:dihydroorotate dehydrogenase